MEYGARTLSEIHCGGLRKAPGLTLARATGRRVFTLSERLRFLIVFRIRAFERRAVEDHFRDQLARDAIVNPGARPVRFGAFALAERDDLVLEFVWMVNEQWAPDQLDLLIGEEADRRRQQRSANQGV